MISSFLIQILPFFGLRGLRDRWTVRQKTFVIFPINMLSISQQAIHVSTATPKVPTLHAAIALVWSTYCILPDKYIVLYWYPFCKQFCSPILGFDLHTPDEQPCQLKPSFPRRKLRSSRSGIFVGPEARRLIRGRGHFKQLPWRNF